MELSDKKKIIEAINQNGNSLYFTNNELENDREDVLKAVKQDWRALEYARDELKSDKDIILEAIKQHNYTISESKKNEEISLKTNENTDKISRKKSLKEYFDSKLDDMIYFGEKVMITGGIALSVLSAVQIVNAVAPDVANVNQQEVSVTVEDTNFSPGYSHITKINNLTSVNYRPSSYEVSVEYDGETYVLDDYLAYYQYKDKIGEEVIGTLETKTYENGETKCSIKSLELPEMTYKLETENGEKEYTIINIADGQYDTTYYTNDGLEIVVDKDGDCCKIYDTNDNFIFKNKIEQYKDTSFSFEEVSNSKQQDFSF